MFQKAVPTQDVTNPVSLPSSYRLQHIPLHLDYMQYFIFSQDQSHWSPPSFWSLFPNCPSFSTIQSCAPSL